jgi:hypothetical protein
MRYGTDMLVVIDEKMRSIEGVGSTETAIGIEDNQIPKKQSRAHS